MFNFNTFLVLIAALQCSSTQYLPYRSQPSQPTMDVCNNSSNTALIESFFNMIFSEFHNTPPVCVCVQMCAEQPTYCYPNGCLKLTETKKKKEDVPETLQVSPAQEKTGNVASFMVDDHTGFLNSFFDGEPSPIRSKSELAPIAAPAPALVDGIQRPDPFKDKYKSLFKFKKSPKVHLRYNLREQVKNTKSDVIKIEKVDVGKAKWPMPDKQFFFETPDTQATHSETGTKYSRFFKRDLGKSKSKIEEKIAQTVEENKTEKSSNNSFSLENLIENLIETNFGPLQNDTELDLNVNLDFNIDNNLTTSEPITMPSRRNLLKKNSIVIINETTYVISMNMTKENVDQNKYNEEQDSKETNKSVFSEMIANLAKNIEKQNNNSMELMEMYLGRRINEENEVTKETDTTSITNKNEIKETSEIVPDTIGTPVTTRISTEMSTDLLHSTESLKLTTTDKTIKTTAGLEKISETQQPIPVTHKKVFKNRIVVNKSGKEKFNTHRKSRQILNRRKKIGKNN